MKLLAILLPIAVIFGPTLVIAVFVAVKTVRGQAIEGAKYPAKPLGRRKANLLLTPYCLALAASLSWACYVFTGDVFLTVMIAIVLTLCWSVAVFLNPFTRSLPRPPLEGYQDDKAYLEYQNRLTDAWVRSLGKDFVRLFLFVVGAVLVFIAAMTLWYYFL